MSITNQNFLSNVEETPGTQLQTILIDNDGSNLWTTESWGGANMVPNTSWTTSDMHDYFYNGTLSFEVKSNGQTSFPFNIGITSHSHNEDVTIYWTSMDKYKDITASPEWTSYTLPLNELTEAFPDKGFDKKNVWKISVGGIKSGKAQIHMTTGIFQSITENAIWTVMQNGHQMKTLFTEMRQ